MKKTFAGGIASGLARCLVLCLILTAMSGIALAESVTIVEEHAYIRETPGLSGEILRTIPVGASASYLNESWTDVRNVPWYKVSYGNVTGWVSGLHILSNPDGSSNYGPYALTITACMGDCNIRSDASTSARILGILPQGFSADFLGEYTYDDFGRQWCKVYYDGVTGWVEML